MKASRSANAGPVPPDRCAECPLRRLELFTPFGQETIGQIQSVRSRNMSLPDGSLIHVAGQPVEQGFTLFDGYAMTYRLLDDGSRQVTRFVLPGGLLYFQDGGGAHWADTSEAIGPVVLCSFADRGLKALSARELHVAQALARIREAEEEMLAEHITDLGRRSSTQRVARLYLEIFFRQRAHGRTRDGRCPFPFTQEQVGDAIGLSGAHVNRVLARLRAEGMMQVRRRVLHIPDFDAAARAFDFDPIYLHPRPLI